MREIKGKKEMNWYQVTIINNGDKKQTFLLQAAQIDSSDDSACALAYDIVGDGEWFVDDVQRLAYPIYPTLVDECRDCKQAVFEPTDDDNDWLMPTEPKTKAKSKSKAKKAKAK